VLKTERKPLAVKFIIVIPLSVPFGYYVLVSGFCVPLTVIIIAHLKGNVKLQSGYKHTFFLQKLVFFKNTTTNFCSFSLFSVTKWLQLNVIVYIEKCKLALTNLQNKILRFAQKRSMGFVQFAKLTTFTF